jgi:hypothetical protein
VESEVTERQHQHAVIWKDIAARSIVWAIGQDSPSLSSLCPPAPVWNTPNSSRKASVAPLRRTFGSICLLRCPRLHTLSSLHFGGRWICPTASPDVYVAGSCYSASSSAALHEAPGIIASLLPVLPTTPELIRFIYTCVGVHCSLLFRLKLQAASVLDVA